PGAGAKNREPAPFLLFFLRATNPPQCLAAGHPLGCLASPNVPLAKPLPTLLGGDGSACYSRSSCSPSRHFATLRFERCEADSRQLWTRFSARLCRGTDLVCRNLLLDI